MNGKDEPSIFGEQMRREQECISSNRRYASLAQDTALTTMLNEFIQREEDHLRILRNLAGDAFAVDEDVFEEQAYHDQAGGPNPKGYRQGGTAGTEPLSGERISPETINQAFRDRPAGDNLGWRELPPNDLRYVRTDSLLESRLPPDIVPEDGEVLKGSKEAASLMADSYAAAASQVGEPQVRDALLALGQDTEDHLRRLEEYRPPRR